MVKDIWTTYQKKMHNDQYELLLVINKIIYYFTLSLSKKFRELAVPSNYVRGRVRLFSKTTMGMYITQLSWKKQY